MYISQSHDIQHWPPCIAADRSPKSGNPEPCILGNSGTVPDPIFGIIGIPFSSNFNPVSAKLFVIECDKNYMDGIPGAISFIISEGICPYLWMSNINSINLETDFSKHNYDRAII